MASVRFMQYDGVEPLETYLMVFEAGIASLDLKDNEEGKRKMKNLLISNIGVRTVRILNSLTAPKVANDKSYDELICILKRHFVPNKKLDKARLLFVTSKKEPQENVRTFYSRLMTLAVDCSFSNFEERICEQLFLGIRDEPYYQWLANDKDFDFLSTSPADLLERISVLELNQGQSKSTNVTKTETVNKTNNGRLKNGKCNCCGNTKHKTQDCWFKNKKCFKCGKEGHITKMCRNKKKENSDNEEESEYESVPRYRRNVKAMYEEEEDLSDDSFS